jgi:anti-sigma B factor antagonist
VTLPNGPTPVRESLEHVGLTIDVIPAEGMDVIPSAETYVVQLVGELDLDSVPFLENELRRMIAGRTGTLIVDLERLEFIDSTGLQSLFEIARAAEADGDALRFRRATGHVEQMLQLTDIKKQLRFLG